MRNILLFSILCLFFTKLNAQKEEVLIKHFVRDLFDVNIPEHAVVSKYLVELKSEKKFSISLDERKKIQLGHIKQIRQEMQGNEIDSKWLIPQKTNANPKNIAVKYKDFKQLDKFEFHERKIEALTEKMYVLLDPDKKKILQYFFVEEGKIKYFTLFVKSGEASFFGH